MKCLLLTFSAFLLALSWAQDCSKCSRTAVNTNTVDPTEPLVHSPNVSYAQNTAGCSTMTVSCTPIQNNPTNSSLMTFQNGLGGPTEGNPATATLICGAEGQWMFSQGGVSTAITVVSCFG